MLGLQLSLLLLSDQAAGQAAAAAARGGFTTGASDATAAATTSPSDTSLETAVTFLNACGQSLLAAAPKGVHLVFERLREILHDGCTSQRMQYTIQNVFASRKDKFAAHPALADPKLDLVEAGDQVTHELDLDAKQLDVDAKCNVFRMDPEYVKHQQDWKVLRAVDHRGQRQRQRRRQRQLAVIATATRAGSGSDGSDEAGDSDDEDGASGGGGRRGKRRPRRGWLPGKALEEKGRAHEHPGGLGGVAAVQLGARASA